MSNLGIFGPEFEKIVVIFENQHLRIVKVIVSQQKINC